MFSEMFGKGRFVHFFGKTKTNRVLLFTELAIKFLDLRSGGHHYRRRGSDVRHHGDARGISDPYWSQFRSIQAVVQRIGAGEVETGIDKDYG